MSRCVSCGEELLNGAKFCMHCGQRQPEESEIVSAAAEAAVQEAEMPESSRFFAAATLEETAKAEAVEEAAEVSAAEAPAEIESAPEAPAATEVEEKPAAEPIRLTFDPPAAPSFMSAPAAATAVIEKPTLQEAKPEGFVPQAVPAADPEKPGNKSKWQIMSTWGYIGAVLLMCVPVIGLVFAIVWACGGCRKYAKRNIARATLIFMAAGVVITVAAALVLRFVFPEVLVYAFEFFNPGYTIVF